MMPTRIPRALTTRVLGPVLLLSLFAGSAAAQTTPTARFDSQRLSFRQEFQTRDFGDGEDPSSEDFVSKPPRSNFSFAADVVVDGDVMAVGLPLFRADQEEHVDASGGVAVFERIDGEWVFINIVGNPVYWDFDCLGEPGDCPVTTHQFGQVLAISDGRIVTGRTLDIRYGEEAPSIRVSTITQLGGPYSAWTVTEEFVVDSGLDVATPVSSLALDGDWLAVGIRDDLVFDEENEFFGAGAVYTLKRNSANNAWIRTAIDNRIVSPSPETNANFGASLAMDGDLLVIGEPNRADSGQPAFHPDEGAAYTATRNDGSAVVAASITPGTVEGTDQFGWSVSVASISSSHRVIAVSAPGRRTVGTTSGSVYVLEDTGSGWTLEATLNDAASDGGVNPPDSNPFNNDGVRQLGPFGNRVALAWDESSEQMRLLASRPRERFVEGLATTEFGTQYGFAGYADWKLLADGLVFTRDGVSGDWDLTDELVASGTSIDMVTVGLSADLDGATAVLGDPLNSGLYREPGSAFVFELDQTPPDENANSESDWDEIMDDMSLDTNSDGRIDRWEVSSSITQHCNKQVVFIVDTSESIMLELRGTLENPLTHDVFDAVERLEAELESAGCAEVTLLGLSELFPRIGVTSPRYPDGTARDYSNTVPRAIGLTPHESGDPFALTYPAAPDACNPTPLLVFLTQGQSLDGDEYEVRMMEDWVRATAIVAAHFPWEANSRIIVPIFDDVPCDGGGTNYQAAIDNMVETANSFGVRVCPMPVTLENEPFETTLQALAAQIAADTGGHYFTDLDSTLPGSTTPSSNLYAIAGFGGVLFETLDDFPVPTLECPDVTSTFDPLTGEGGPDIRDGRIQFDDLDYVLTYYDETVAPFQFGDVDGDGLVSFDDLNAVIAAWETSCSCCESLMMLGGGGEGGGESMMSGQSYESSLLDLWALTQGYDTIQDWAASMAEEDAQTQGAAVDDLAEFVAPLVGE